MASNERATERRAKKRFMAILDGQTGYALDYYPEERKRYLRQFAGRYPGRVIGDFSTAEEAMNALRQRLIALRDAGRQLYRK